MVSRFVTDAFAAINLTWVVAGRAERIDGHLVHSRARRIDRSAFAAGTLFALSPYALYRNIDHFALVIYLVPFACAAALWLAAGEPHQTWGRTKRLVIWRLRPARPQLRLLRVLRLVLHSRRRGNRISHPAATGASLRPARSASHSSPAARSSISPRPSTPGTRTGSR